MQQSSLFLFVYLVNSCLGFSLYFNLNVRKTNEFHIKVLRTQLKMSTDEEKTNLTVDISSLSAKEQQRITYIQNAVADAEKLAREGGFVVDDDDKEVAMKAIQDTKWSGQSNMDVNVKSSNDYTDLQARLPLAVGDVGALTLFSAVGRMNHGESADLISSFVTALPFVISWLLLSPYLGAYSMKATATRGDVPLALLPAWGVCIPLALVLRGLLKGAVPPTPFIIVSMTATFVLLTLWRLGFVFLFGESSDGEYRKAGVLEVSCYPYTTYI